MSKGIVKRIVHITSNIKEKTGKVEITAFKWSGLGIGISNGNGGFNQVL